MTHHDSLRHTDKLLDPDAALAQVIAEAVVLPPERVPLSRALGRVSAEALHAPRPMPPFPRAMMDGYAVALADAGRRVPVAGVAAAGPASAHRVTPGRAVEIMTGAVCPPGTEAVVQYERTTRTGDFVTLPQTLAAGANVAPVGSDVAEGAPLAREGDRITPLLVAVLASFGCTEVVVRRRPSWAIVTTGREVVPHGGSAMLEEGMIHDGNGPMLAALGARLGLPPPVTGHADDTPEALRAALEAVGEADIVLVTGGVSAGRYDHVPAALAAHGAVTRFHKVRQKPGKPLLFAVRGTQLYFGLPGNPLAAHLGFSRYVAAAVRRLEGRAAATPLVGTLAQPLDLGAEGRDAFLLARTRWDGERGGFIVTRLPGASSADMYGPALADAYIRIPAAGLVRNAGESIAFTFVAGAEPWEN